MCYGEVAGLAVLAVGGCLPIDGGTPLETIVEAGEAAADLKQLHRGNLGHYVVLSGMAYDHRTVSCSFLLLFVEHYWDIKSSLGLSSCSLSSYDKEEDQKAINPFYE